MPCAIQNLNLPEVYLITYLEINMIDAMLNVRQPKENLYENRLRNRPIPGRCDLPCFRPERLSELHSPAPAGGIAGQFMGALYAAHYLWVIFAFQVIAAVLLLVNRYIPLAVAVLAPVIVNILLVLRRNS
jgi:hypothetical protein